MSTLIPKYQAPLTNSVNNPINFKLQSQVCVYDFMTQDQIVATQTNNYSGSVTDVTTPVQNAINSGRAVFFPAGVYKITSTLTQSSGNFIMIGETYTALTEKNNDENNFTGSVINYFGSNSTPVISPGNYSTTNQIAICNMTIAAPKTMTTVIVKMPGDNDVNNEYYSEVYMNNVRIETRDFSVTGSALSGYTMTGLELDGSTGYFFGAIFNNIYIFGCQTGIFINCYNSFINSNTFSNIKMYQVFRAINAYSNQAGSTIYANNFYGIYVQPNSQNGSYASGVILLNGDVSQNTFIGCNVYDTPSNGLAYQVINPVTNSGKNNIWINCESNDQNTPLGTLPGWGLSAYGTLYSQRQTTILGSSAVDPNYDVWFIQDQATSTLTYPRNQSANDIKWYMSGLTIPTIYMNGIQGNFLTPGGFGTNLYSITTTGSVTLPNYVSRVLNTSGAVTVTLPNPINGSEITFTNNVASAVTSASSNIYPIGGGSLGTAILPATSGKWVSLIADGTYWHIYASN